MTREPRKLLIVEDDERFAETLAAEFRDRGYEVLMASNLKELREVCDTPVSYAVVDLRLRGDNGIDAIPIIKESSPGVKVVVLTGYGSIATAVQATKDGADNYLTKPVSIETIEYSLGIGVRGESELADGDGEEPSDAQDFPSLARHEREYIEYVLAECDGNISEAARRLGLHRQSLQRKLRKYPPR